MNAILTAYVCDFDGNIWEVSLFPQDDCTIEEHVEYVLDGMLSDDELVNIVIH